MRMVVKEYLRRKKESNSNRTISLIAVNGLRVSSVLLFIGSYVHSIAQSFG
jgi:ABC-type lipoprotein release transport system permease subunit